MISVTKEEATAILGIKILTTKDKLKVAFRKKQKETHPDFNEAKNASQQFQKVTEAYKYLKECIDNPKFENKNPFKTKKTYESGESGEKYYKPTSMNEFFVFLKKKEDLVIVDPEFMEKAARISLKEYEKYFYHDAFRVLNDVQNQMRLNRRKNESRR